ncbi:MULTISPECIES: hypothetical protein [Rhodopirellula]|jgi:hypothetical protein|uniref:Membrane protein n=1 Tax=Rhodopirellula europaea 6C TaxID=1263867 RepID=M2B3J4_9BACT|nr:MULTISPECIES: hypothetical protein [Rhodopirellula]EMB16789.1 membrane protein [Rhodopirellula europaea 6C]|tara:strand:- start:459 stop:635 length:177 start_codon:yes stop_codon:yes gene_type:complete
MSRDNYRTIGAIVGLALGIGVMFLFGMSGIVAGAAFGAGGCVIGGIAGEQIFDRRGQR